MVTGRRTSGVGRSTSATAVALGLLWMAPTSASAQLQPGEPTVRRNPDVIGPVTPGRFEGDLRNLPRVAAWRVGDAVREVNPRRLSPPTVEAETPSVQPTPAAPIDPLFAGQADVATVRQDRVFSSPTLNFPGQGFSGALPPDTVGDVGPSHYIQSVNGPGGSNVVIYNKVGTPVAGPFTMASLGAGACASGSGDPIVLYDQLADRWLLTEFASPPNNTLCVYVSMTNDPVAGGWHRFNFPTPNFPDYPKYGVWPDAYYVGTNEGLPAVYAMDRTQMLAGNPATMQRFTAPALDGFGFQNLIPADLDGATAPVPGAPNPFMRHRDDEAHNPGANNPGMDFLEVFEFHVDFATPANSTFTGPMIPVAEFDSELCGFVSFNCFPQPNGQQLDPLREVIMHRLVYRNFGTHQTLVGNYTTDVDGTDRGGIRWFELRKVGAGPWTLFQEGLHSPDATHRWMGSIAMDGSGNVALGYSVASPTVRPGLRYAGRLASDPAGTLAQGEHPIIAGTGSQANVNRWGDYSAMGIDPADDCTFWYTNEYVPASGNWRTRIASFKFASCGAGAPPAVQNFMVTPNGLNADFTWDAVPGATGYKIEVGSAPGLSDLLVLPLGAVTTLSAVAPPPGGVFHVGIRALIGILEGPRTEIVVTLPGGGCTTAPDAPTGLSFTPAGVNVTLNWTASTGCPATSYIVEAGSAPGLSNLGRFDTGSAAPTITASGPSNTYHVRVLGTNPFGTSGPSNEVIITIP